MKTFLYSLVFFLIIGLGLFGLLFSFIDNPSALLVQLLIVAIVASVGLLLFRRLAEGMGNGEQTRYKKAAKRSARRFKSQSHAKKNRPGSSSRLKVISNESSHRHPRALSHHATKEHGHLTVIDGKKNKKKKRVLF